MQLFPGAKLIKVTASYHWSKIGRSSYLDTDVQDRRYRAARVRQAFNKEGLPPRRHADVCCSARLPHVLRVHTFLDLRSRVAGRFAGPRLLRVVAKQSAKPTLYGRCRANEAGPRAGATSRPRPLACLW